MAVSKPSVDEITTLFEKVKTTYSTLQSQFELDEEFYECAFKNRLKLPEQYKNDGIVLPTGRDMVDTAVDHTDIAHARIYVNKKGTKEMNDEDVENMRKFALGIIHRVNVESSISPLRQSAKHYWLHGLAVLKTLWDADDWLYAPEQKEGESDNHYAGRLDEWRFESGTRSLPIIIKAVNPATIYPDPNYGGRLYVFEANRILTYDAKLRYPNWKNKASVASDEYVDHVRYSDKNYRCEMINNETILKTKVDRHGYGFIPYTLIESGLGNLAKDAAPEKRYVGLLRYMTDLLVSESLNYSMADILMKWETMKGGYITGADAATLPEVKQEYGTYWPMGDKDVTFHDWERQLAPQEAYAHLALTHDYISIHGTPRSLMGIGETGVRSGADRRLVLAEAGSKFNYSKDSFANGWALVLAKCALLLKNVIPGDINVWARTPTDEFDVLIKKDMVKEPFSYYVEFAPISEEDEYRRQDALNKMWNGGNGLITKEWARKQMSNINPKDMERQEMKEQIRMLPTYNMIKDQVMAQLFQEALGEAGLIPLPQGQGGPQGGGGPQGPGRGLVPPVPERAMPGSMGALENQWRSELKSGQAPIQTQGRGGGGNRG